jgi:hypothetical protein
MKNENDPKYFSNFKNDIEGEKRFHLEGWERIKKYYETHDEEKRYKETNLKNPPHDSIKDKAISFIRLSTSESREIGMADFASDVLLGVGVELLLKSIILKENPKIFINNTKEKNNQIITPSFNKCKEITCELLKDVLDEEQLERVNDVLTLINMRRNELAHLHFTQWGDYAFPYQILNVLEFLFEHYFPEEREFISWLSQLKEKNKVGSEVFKPVEFPKLGVSRR